MLSPVLSANGEVTTATSIRFALNASIASGVDILSIFICIFGCSRWNSTIRSIRKLCSATSLPPSLTIALSRSLISASSSSAENICLQAMDICLKSISPPVVSSTPFFDRTKSLHPSSSSRFFTHRLMLGCDKNR